MMLPQTPSANNPAQSPPYETPRSDSKQEDVFLMTLPAPGSVVTRQPLYKRMFPPPSPFYSPFVKRGTHLSPNEMIPPIPVLPQVASSGTTKEEKEFAQAVARQLCRGELLKGMEMRLFLINGKLEMQTVLEAQRGKLTS